MIAAAAITPYFLPSAPKLSVKPCGMNGCRLLASNAGSAIATNTASAMSLATTNTALRVALSRVPAINKPATTHVINTAGRLIKPPECEPTLMASGRSTPMPFKNPTA